MSVAINSPVLKSKDDSLAIVQGTLVLSGNYVAGGDTLPDLATLPVLGIFKNAAILKVDFDGQAGYIYKWVPGNASNNHKIKVFIPTTPSGNSPASEHSAAAYNAAASGDTIRVIVTFITAPNK